MAVKVDPEVLASTVVALEAAAGDVPSLISRAGGLGASGDVSGLSGVEAWATDTARDLTKRIGIVEQLNSDTVTLGGVEMDPSIARTIAGGGTPIDDAMLAVVLADPDDDRWQDTSPANAGEWFEQLQEDALRRLGGIRDEETAEALVEAFNVVNDLAQAGVVTVATTASIFKVGGPALANLLARTQVATPVINRLAQGGPQAVSWANRLSSALNTADDFFVRSRTQFRYPGSFVPNAAGSIATRLTPIAENFDAWVTRMASRTQPFPAGTSNPTLLARLVNSSGGTRATSFVSRILQTQAGSQLPRVASWTNNIIGRPWVNPANGSVYGRGAGNLVTMARTSGMGTMARSAGVLRLGGAGFSALATVDGAIGMWNNRAELAQMWQEGGTEGKAHVVGEVAETAFNASMTAAMVAPNPLTLGAVAVTGVVWAGAEIVEHWDEISAAAGEAAEWAGDRAEEAVDWAEDRWDDVKESDLNPMNWF